MNEQPGHNTRLHNGYIDDLTTERSFDSQATWVIGVLDLFLACCSWVFVRPGTGKCPVVWCKNQMSVVYFISVATENQLAHKDYTYCSIFEAKI